MHIYSTRKMLEKEKTRGCSLGLRMSGRPGGRPCVWFQHLLAVPFWSRDSSMTTAAVVAHTHLLAFYYTLGPDPSSGSDVSVTPVSRFGYGHSSSASGLRDPAVRHVAREHVHGVRLVLGRNAGERIGHAVGLRRMAERERGDAGVRERGDRLSRVHGRIS